MSKTGKPNKASSTKKTSRQTVIKDKDMIKDTDFEKEKSDNKKILVVALILALLIGGFAYIRSLDKKDKEEDDKTVVDKKDDDKDQEVVPPSEPSEQTTNSNMVTTTPNTTTSNPTTKEEPVDIWAPLNNIVDTIEAGDMLELPEISDNDNGNKVYALITYQFRTNSDEDYTAVEEFDTTMIGEYLITYVIEYSNGTVDSREFTITVIDTMPPIINIIDGSYYADEVMLEITEYSPYTVTVNDLEYDPSKPITDDGIYTVVITEDKEMGMSTIVHFTIDTVEPVISNVEDQKYYNEASLPLLIEVTDDYIDTIVVTRDGEEIPFESGVTSITEDGVYQITATDLAKNQVVYNFVVDTISPNVTVSYDPNNNELTTSDVTVTLSADEMLDGIDGWVLASDQMSLTQTFTENTTMIVEVKDLAGNTTNVEIVIDYIDYNVSYKPSLTMENLVANKVKAIISSIMSLEIEDEGWVEQETQDGTYRYEKIYEESGKYTVNYKLEDGTEESIEINISIELDEAFVTYVISEAKHKVTVYVETEEEVISIPEGWSKDTEYEEGYRYYKEYTENVDYEYVLFATEHKNYAVTIVIDSIVSEEVIEPDELKVVDTNVSYTTNDEGIKTKVIVAITFNHEMQSNYAGWVISLNRKTLTYTIDRPEEVPQEEQTVTVFLSDIDGNEIEVPYTYSWN